MEPVWKRMLKTALNTLRIIAMVFCLLVAFVFAIPHEWKDHTWVPNPIYLAVIVASCVFAYLLARFHRK